VDLPVRKPEALGIVVVELWCVRGSMIWDHVQVVGVGADGIVSRYGSDQTLVAGSFIRAAQNPALGHRPLGVGTVTPASGVLSTEMMLHHEHEQYASKIEEMSNRDD